MKVFKIFVDFDKEERYLDSMCQKGYALVKYSSMGVYTFHKIKPQSLNYKVDYRVFKNNSQFQEYVTLFEDAGWEHVYGTRYSGSQYFLTKSSETQNEDIFSDMESKAGRHKRLYTQCLSSFLLMIVFFITTTPDAQNKFLLSDFRSWYFTPHLWEQTGAKFWNAFLFETPFVILRVFPNVFLMILTIVYGIWAFKAYNIYKKKKPI